MLLLINDKIIIKNHYKPFIELSLFFIFWKTVKLTPRENSANREIKSTLNFIQGKVIVKQREQFIFRKIINQSLELEPGIQIETTSQ